MATLDADRRQAKVFGVELRRQIELLNEQAEVFRQALTTYIGRREFSQARRMQKELRLCAVERRSLIDMLSALCHRFSPEGAETGPAIGPRHASTDAAASLNRTGRQARAGIGGNTGTRR